MRISRLMMTPALALSITAIAYSEPPTIPRAEPTAAPADQPRILPAPNQPGQPRVQPGQPIQVQPGQPQPGQPQLQPNTTTITANKPVVGDQANQNASRQIASLLAICNDKEVKLAELAKNKSKNKEVQQFAEMMIKDHSEALGNLSKFGGQSGLGTTNAAEQTNRTDSSRPATAAGATSNQGALDFVAVHRQAAQQCLSKAEKKWNDHKSPESDMAYIGAQLVAHEEFINHAQAMRQYASPELQKEIDRQVSSAEQHRDEAHKLIQTLGEQEQKKSS